jgi:hypothetical protein
MSSTRLEADLLPVIAREKSEQVGLEIFVEANVSRAD